MKEYPVLSANDKTIMELVWENGEASTAYLVKILDGQANWNRHTVKTYLIRLCEKGLLERIELSARRFKVVPNVSKEEYYAGNAKQYLNQNFNGLTHMVAGLVKNEMISDIELDNLEKFIHSLKEEK